MPKKANAGVASAFDDPYSRKKKKRPITKDIFSIGQAIRNIKKLKKLPRTYGGMKEKY